MQYPRPRVNCNMCPLAGHKPVWSELGASERAPLIAIVGEAPGREENRDGKPFTGPSGKLVNWAIVEAGISRANVYIANAICCHLDERPVDSLEAQDALSFCRAGLFDELATQYDRGLRVVLALGQVALDQLGVKGRISTYRGSIMELHLPRRITDGIDRALTLIPTYHPSMVLRLNWKRESGGTAKGAVEWLADWQKAVRVAREYRETGDNTLVKLEERFQLAPTVEDVERFCDEAIEKKSLLAIDIETTGLSFDKSRIVVIGIATSSEDAICVPILKAYDAAFYNVFEIERVKKALERLFSSCDQIYQNCYFDVPRLRKWGLTVPYDRIKHDTMLLSHTLHSESPHDLGYITSLYGKTPYWKETFKNREGSIFDMNPLEMRRYNLRDCVVLHQVLPVMLAELCELKLEDVYYNEAIPLIRPIMQMTQYGVGIDMPKVARHRQYLEQLATERELELYSLGDLPSEFNVGSGSQMRWFLYGEAPSTFARIDERDAKKAEKRAAEAWNQRELREAIDEAQKAFEEARSSGRPLKALEKRIVSAKARLEKRLAAAEKPQSQVDRDIEALRVVRDKVRPLYQLTSWSPPTTDSGLLATDREGLLSFKIALNNRRAEALAWTRKDSQDTINRIDRLLAFIEKLGEVSRIRKIASTYTSYEPWEDGRIHPYWKQHGTASGRLASTQPNLTNLPSLDPDKPDPIVDPVRGFFVSRPGYSFISADYVNLEAQLLAYSTLDPELCDVFEHGKNLHDVNTRALFGIEKSSPEWHACRHAAKIDFFGNKCYGGSDYAIFQKIMLEVPDLKMTFSAYQAANKRWFTTHPAYTKWARNVRETVREKREARTPLGRARFFLHNDRDIEKEALNHMIQSSGATLVNRAMIRLDERLRIAAWDAEFVLQVHDELILEAHDSIVESVRDALVEEMSRPFMFNGHERRIPVEATVGKSLAEL